MPFLNPPLMNTSSRSSLIVALLFIFSMVSSHASVSVIDSTLTTFVDKEKPNKKKAPKQHASSKKWVLSTLYASYRSTETMSTMSLVPILSTILIILLLLAIPSLFLIGGLTGGIGWLISGTIGAVLWLLLAYTIVLLKEPYSYSLGLVIFIFLATSFIANLIWALLSGLSILLILSAILGGLALIGILIYIINEINWHK